MLGFLGLRVSAWRDRRGRGRKGDSCEERGEHSHRYRQMSTRGEAEGARGGDPRSLGLPFTACLLLCLSHPVIRHACGGGGEVIQ